MHAVFSWCISFVMKWPTTTWRLMKGFWGGKLTRTTQPTVKYDQIYSIPDVSLLAGQNIQFSFEGLPCLPPPKLTDSFSKLGLKGFLKTHLNMYFLFWFYTPTIYHITRPWGWAIGHLFSFLTSNCDLPTFHSKKKNDAGQPCVSKMVGIWFKLKRLPTNGSIVGISSKIISTNSRFFCFY